ncbi:hypothetical protein [Wolbachia endosymbiont of Drosophila tsacasi]|uniref:hypothetical protein n=1 Tax=Wolbachia endosymbiont of Drosophila tsacasi TaxID=3002579 RepID=UPI0023A9ED8D|nr:hypothetical protein [Wolbachia endosymbiont of Drosophila tsacasi]MDE5062689.1 hypothetical protein [Wolbachia endosymbiont of Drosophila tsacasi]
MKMKRLCVLAVLLTASLAGAANNSASKSGASKLEDQYYAGLNFGAGWGSGFVMKPSVVFGYHHDKNSKFELEVLANMSDIAKDTRKIGASLLANYRYYPDLDIDPVKLYVSGGLGGYLQVIPFGSVKESASPEGGGAAAEKKESVVDKILSSISYKLKVGVDYEIAPQIVGTAGVTAGGQLSHIKAKQIPDAILEVGIRYNF